MAGGWVAAGWVTAGWVTAGRDVAVRVGWGSVPGSSEAPQPVGNSSAADSSETPSRAGTPEFLPMLMLFTLVMLREIQAYG